MEVIQVHRTNISRASTQIIPVRRPVAPISHQLITIRFVATISTVAKIQRQTHRESRLQQLQILRTNQMKKKSITRRDSSTSAGCATSIRCMRMMTRNVWTKSVRAIRISSNQLRNSTNRAWSAISGWAHRTSDTMTFSARIAIIRSRRHEHSKEIMTYYNQKVASVAATITIDWRTRRRCNHVTVLSSGNAENANKITTHIPARA